MAGAGVVLEGARRIDRGLLVAAGCGAAASGVLAAVVAQAGAKGLLVAGAAAVLAVGLLLIRERALFVLLVLLLGLQFVLHRSLGPIDTAIASGASAIYVTTIDALLLLLYGLWFLQGTLIRDLRAASRERILLLAAVGVVLSLPSVLVAENLYVAIAELVRMSWMYALFVYVALRVRNRRELGWVIAALFAVVLIQCAIVVAQWRLGDVLGLAVLGEEETLYVRTLDGAAEHRPTGTAIHPTILAALVAPIGLLALALAVNLETARARIACLLVGAAGFLPLVLSQTRAAIVAAGVATVLLLGASLARGRVSVRTALVALAVGLGLCWYFWPEIETRVLNNLGTDQFRLEIEARLELNAVALDMSADHMVVGVGLNNFMEQMDRYARFGVIYVDYPVHNLYLLVLAETGVLGLGALIVTLGVLSLIALRLARERDRLMSAIGAGMAAVYTFFVLEELLGYSLRTDIPLALFWVLAGLSIACTRILRDERQVEAKVAAHAT